MFNNNTTATCPQSAPVKKFENRSTFDEDMDNHKVRRFLRHSVDSATPQMCRYTTS